VLLDVQLVAQQWTEAIATATDVAELCARLGDPAGEASARLRLARASLMQMKDPYAAAGSALAAAQIATSAGEACAALHIAAQAQLLYDPEQALKVGKEALARCDDEAQRIEVAQTIAAAKTHIATMQQADQATSVSCRGDGHIPHKWPQYAQQTGERPADPFVVDTYVKPSPPPEEKPAVAKAQKNMFMRKTFKWTDGRHITDSAWYRQELRFIPPPH